MDKFNILEILTVYIHDNYTYLFSFNLAMCKFFQLHMQFPQYIDTGIVGNAKASVSHYTKQSRRVCLVFYVETDDDCIIEYHP